MLCVVLQVKEIVALAKSSNYQVACQKHFDVTHPGHQQMPDLAVGMREGWEGQMSCHVMSCQLFYKRLVFQI